MTITINSTETKILNNAGKTLCIFTGMPAGSGGGETISCTGALNQEGILLAVKAEAATDQTAINNIMASISFNINGQSYTVADISSGNISHIVDIPPPPSEVPTGTFPAGYVQFQMMLMLRNKSANNLRITVSSELNNPNSDLIFGYVGEGAVTVQTDARILKMCLSPSTEENPDRFIPDCSVLGWNQHYTELDKVRLSLPYLDFNNVAFNVYIDGELKLTEKALTDVTAMTSIGLEVESLSDGAKAVVYNKTGKAIALELEPTMPILTDVDVYNGFIQDGKFYSCLKYVAPV